MACVICGSPGAAAEVLTAFLRGLSIPRVAEKTGFSGFAIQIHRANHIAEETRNVIRAAIRKQRNKHYSATMRVRRNTYAREGVQHSPLSSQARSEAYWLYALVGVGNHTEASVRAGIELSEIDREVLREEIGPLRLCQVEIFRQKVLQEFDALCREQPAEIILAAAARRKRLAVLYRVRPPRISGRGIQGRRGAVVNKNDDWNF